MKEVKQVIVWRNDLKVRKGKLAVQIAHASVKAVLNHLSIKNIADKDSYMHKWLTGDHKKICVYVNSKQELMDLCMHAVDCKLPNALITDNGLTEFKEPTMTALAIGPYWSEEIDKLTKDLPLL